MPPATKDIAAFIGGFVAAEGNFRMVGKRPRFTFAMGLGATDSSSCEALHAFFGVGSIHRRARRRERYDDEVTFHVQGRRDLVEVIVPFMDEHLPPSHKREQYLRWREELLWYWDVKARRRRPCKVAGCDAPSRAFGLCRHHYYAEFRR